MGVSYFSCDECGCVMNDAGGHEYYRMEYYTAKDKQFKNGVFCQDCSDEIRQSRAPRRDSYNRLFVLRTNGVESLHVLQKLNKKSLKLLIERLKTADEAYHVPTSIKKRQNPTHVWAEYQTNNQGSITFENPETVYNEHLEYLPEECGYERAYSWFFPPSWPNDTADKKRRSSRTF